MTPREREELVVALAESFVELDAARLSRALLHLEPHELVRLLDVVTRAASA